MGNILVERFNGVPSEERLHWRTFLVKLGADNLKGARNEELFVPSHNFPIQAPKLLTRTKLSTFKGSINLNSEVVDRQCRFKMNREFECPYCNPSSNNPLLKKSQDYKFICFNSW